MARPIGPVRAVPVQIRLKAASVWRAKAIMASPRFRSASRAGAVEDEALLAAGQRRRLGGRAALEAREQADDLLEAALDRDLLAAHEDVGERPGGGPHMGHLLRVDRDLASAAL